MSFKPPTPFGGGINSKAVTSSSSGEGYSSKVGSLSFSSPVSASAVSKKIFDIKATEDKTNISTPMLSGSGKVGYVGGYRSGLRRGVRKFGGLGLQGKPDGYSVRNMFEGSFTEEGMGEGNAIFEGGFKFAASEARNNVDITDSAVQREEDRSTYPPTKEHQKLEGKLKHRVK